MALFRRLFPNKNIQKAIDDCSAKGGGIVLFPADCGFTGPIVLKNNESESGCRRYLVVYSR